ncbi:flagellar motor protein MotB [bacterium]|nr:flagellar motor protein MotB [bacterium]MBU1881598.1 flagellar motor protein MotB [bacterium]
MPKKKKGGGHDGPDERWLITYADLITLLLGLFVVLWTMGLADLEEYGRVAAAMKTVFGGKALVEGLPQKTSAAGPYVDADGGSFPDTSEAYLTVALAESMKDISEIAGAVSIEIEERGVVVHLTETVLFESGRAKMQEEALKLLREIAPVLVKSGRPIVIEGHTDNIPIRTMTYQSNWQLSAARAANVVEYLTDRAGVPGGQMAAAAYADQKPVESNVSPEGRAKNRRVDIVFLKGRWQQNEPVKHTDALGENDDLTEDHLIHIN